MGRAALIRAEESESGRPAVMMDGGNFQCGFHLDNGGQARRRKNNEKSNFTCRSVLHQKRGKKCGKLSISELVLILL